MHVDDGQLSIFLFDNGLMPRAHIERARALAEERNEPLHKTLTRAGFLGDDEVRRALAHVLGVPFIMVSHAPDTDVLVLLPEAFSRAHSAIAVGASEDSVEVAFLELDDIKPVQEFFGARRRVLPRLTDKASLTRALVHYQRYLKEKFGGALSGVRADIDPADAFLSHALLCKAEGAHVEPHRNGFRVRYRIGGELVEAMTLPHSAGASIRARVKALANIPHDAVHAVGRFKIAGREGASVGVTTLPVVFDEAPAEKLVLHFSHDAIGRAGFSLSSLGFHGENERDVEAMLKARSGVILVCGEEGGGVTTTLYTLLDNVASPSKSVATVEARVGRTLPGVSHTEVGGDGAQSPISALRAALRADTDIVMIDCPLDEDLAALAVHAADRGTLVFMGVEAAEPAAGIQLVLSLGVPAETLSTVFAGAIGVRVAPRLCGRKARRRILSRTELTLLEDACDIPAVLSALREEGVIGQHTPWKDVALFTAEGCEQCEGGYAGNIGIQEVLPASGIARANIKHAKSGRSYADDALFKAAQGRVSVETLFAIIEG